jgi:hypothetical protein
MAKRDPAACPQRGEKWESSGNTRQKQGKARCAKGLLPRISRGADFLGWMRGRSIDVMSLPSGQPSVSIPGLGLGEPDTLGRLQEGWITIS